MKTKTHYLYGFIIVSLLVALVITSLSKPTPKTIETTPPVERTTEMVTLPPSDTDEDTDDNTEKIYHDKYYTIATYIFVFFIICMVTLFIPLKYQNNDNEKTRFFFWVSLLLQATYVTLSIISIVNDTLYVNQYVILSFYLLSVLPVWYIFALPSNQVKKGNNDGNNDGNNIKRRKQRKSNIDPEQYLSELLELENIERSGGTLTEEQRKRKRILQGILTELINTSISTKSVRRKSNYY